MALDRHRLSSPINKMNENGFVEHYTIITFLQCLKPIVWKTKVWRNESVTYIILFNLKPSSVHAKEEASLVGMLIACELITSVSDDYYSYKLVLFDLYMTVYIYTHKSQCRYIYLLGISESILNYEKILFIKHTSQSKCFWRQEICIYIILRHLFVL